MCVSVLHTIFILYTNYKKHIGGIRPSVQSIAETLQRLNNALSAIGCIFATFQRKSKNDYKDDLQETHTDSEKK